MSAPGALSPVPAPPDLPPAAPLDPRVVSARPFAGRVIVELVGLQGTATLTLSAVMAARLVAAVAEGLARNAAPESPPRDDFGDD